MNDRTLLLHEKYQLFMAIEERQEDLARHVFTGNYCSIKHDELRRELEEMQTRHAEINKLLVELRKETS